MKRKRKKERRNVLRGLHDMGEHVKIEEKNILMYI